MTRKIALSIFIISITLTTVTLYAGQPSMEIISIDPASPAVLEPGQRLYVKFRYNSGNAESIQTWVRPGNRVKGCKSHPCGPLKDKEGIYEGWFFFDDNAAEVKSIKLVMRETGKKGYICEKSVPVDIKWKAPNDEWPRGYATPNSSLQIISTDPVLPTALKLGEELKIKFRFDAGNAKSIKIQSWPNNRNICFPSGKIYDFNGSNDSVGEYEYSLTKNKPDPVKNVKIRIVNADTERVIVEKTYLLDAKCGKIKADEPKKAVRRIDRTASEPKDVSKINSTAGKPSMEVISTDPPSPAVLEPGQQFFVKYRYNSGGAESIQTWVRADGSMAGGGAHGAFPFTDKIGESEGWFRYYDRAAEVKGIRLIMRNVDDERTVLFKDTVPIDVKWRALKTDEPDGYMAPNTSVKIISTDPPLPAKLKTGEKLTMKFRYEIGNSKPVKLGARVKQKKDGKRPKDSRPSYIQSSDKTGEYEYTVTYYEPMAISQIGFSMSDVNTKKSLMDYVFPVDIAWDGATIAEPETQIDPFHSVHAHISKRNARKYEGIWTYKIEDHRPKVSKTIILQGKRNEQGEMKFSFLHQDIYDRPVFVKCSIDNYRANVYFKLNNNQTVMYYLNRNKQNLVGTVYSPYGKEQKITLRKLKLPQAIIDLFENDVWRINRLGELLGEVRADAKEQKSESHKIVVSLKNKIIESQKQIREVQKKHAKLEQEHARTIEDNRKHIAKMSERHDKLALSLLDTIKSYQESEEHSKATIRELENTTYKLELKLKEALKEMDKLRAGITELSQRNKALEEKSGKAVEQNDILMQQNEKLRKDKAMLKEHQARLQKIIKELEQKLEKSNTTTEDAKQQSLPAEE